MALKETKPNYYSIAVLGIFGLWDFLVADV